MKRLRTSEARPGSVELIQFRELTRMERLRWIVGWVCFCIAAIFVDYAILDYAVEVHGPRYIYLVYFPAVVAVAVVFVGLWLTRMGRTRPVFEMHEQGAWFPYSRFSRRRRWIPYDQIVSLGWFRRPPFSRYFIGLPRLIACAYKPGWFDDEVSIGLIEARILEGIARLPDGDERLRKIARGRAVSDSALSRRNIVSMGFATLLSAVFLYQWASGALDDKLLMMWQGPVVWWLIADPGPFVFVSSTLMHMTWWHFLLNGICLVLICQLVEPILGRWRSIAVLLTGGFLTSLSTLLFYDGAALGFSGALSALVGAFVAINIVKRDDLAAPYRAPWQIGAYALAVTAGFSLVVAEAADLAQAAGFSLVVAEVADLAHAAGFMIGFLLVLPMLRSLDPLHPNRTPPIWIRIFALATCLVYLVGMGQWIDHLRSTEVIDTLRVASRHWDEPRFDLDQGTAFALALAIQPQVTTSDLEAALGRARRVLAELPENSVYTREELVEVVAFIEERLAEVAGPPTVEPGVDPSADPPLTSDSVD